VPPESSACWPALTSGVNPGETGVYGFQDREVGSYDTYVPMGRDVQATRVWDRVTEAGLNATVMNVPVTFPPQRTVQRMVSGYLSPDVDKAAHPEELRKYLTESDYRLSVNAKLGHRKDKAEFIEQARQTLDARAEAFSRYVEMDDWDLFVGVFSTPDRINHFLWGDYEDGGPYREDMLAFYAALDEHIGNIRKRSRTTFGSSSAPRTGLRDSDTTCTATSGSNARGGSRTKAATTTDRCPTSPATPARTRWSPDASTSTWRAASPTASSPSRSTRRSARSSGPSSKRGKGRTGTPSRNGSSNARRCSAATTTLSPPTSW